jgi:Glycosyltransferase
MPDQRPLHLGIYYSPFPGWTAYVNYLTNLTCALKVLTPAPEISLLVRKGVQADSSIAGIDSVIEIPDEFTIPDRLPGIVKKVLRRGIDYFEPNVVDRVCLQNHIDAVFAHSIYRPSHGHRVPLLSWIPDFQHMRLPEIFSKDEIEYRNHEFADVVRKADCIVVSSQDAQQDLARYSPPAASRSVVVSFVTQIDAGIYAQNGESICEKYHLPQKFFYLPNQFWMHKNHQVVIAALERLHASHPEIAVVCSGGVNDYRDPAYFANLLGEISQKNVRDTFIMLGLIPYQDVHLLMRQSCAILQPSLFEGWSTTVEEAKSLGKRMLLSDIAVHREQNPPESDYFDPRNSEDLAAKMLKMFTQISAGPDAELENIARQNLPLRTHEYAESFLMAVAMARKNISAH